MHGNIDIILDHFSRLFQYYAAQHAPLNILLYVKSSC